MSSSQLLPVSSRQMTRRTLVSASTFLRLLAWVLSPRVCASGSRICPSLHPRLCQPQQEVVHAALVDAATVDQVTVATPAIRHGHARAPNLHLDAAERRAIAGLDRAPCLAPAHAHHRVVRETEVTRARLLLLDPARLLDGNEPEVTRRLVRLRHAVHDPEAIHAHHRHHVRGQAAILLRLQETAVSAALVRPLADVQGLRHTILALLHVHHHAVAAIADPLQSVAKDHCLLDAGIQARWKDLRHARHLWRNQ